MWKGFEEFFKTDYMDMLMEWGGSFCIIGNLNAAQYKEISPHCIDGTMWFGASGRVNDFDTPRGGGGGSPSLWFTNIEHKRRRDELIVRHRYRPDLYPMSENGSAINVDWVAEIPKDYMGVMAVPVSYLEKHCPAQFDILGLSKNIVVGGEQQYNRLLIKRIA